jgi:hypothetical protein
MSIKCTSNALEKPWFKSPTAAVKKCPNQGSSFTSRSSEESAESNDAALYEGSSSEVIAGSESCTGPAEYKTYQSRGDDGFAKLRSHSKTCHKFITIRQKFRASTSLHSQLTLILSTPIPHRHVHLMVTATPPRSHSSQRVLACFPPSVIAEHLSSLSTFALVSVISSLPSH